MPASANPDPQPIPAAEPPAHAGPWRSAASWLTRTSPAVPAPERRTARLLAWLIAGSFLAGVLSALTILIAPSLGAAPGPTAWMMVLASVVLLMVAFAVNRAGHVRWAAWLVVLVYFAVNWGIALTDQPRYALHPELRAELLFPLLAVLVSGLLLPGWVTALWALANVAALVLFSSFFPLAPSFNLTGLLIFYLLLSLLSGLAGALRYADLAELEAQSHTLAAGEAKYRRIVDLAEEGIWILDSDNRTEFVNRKMAALLGYTEAEMTGAHVFEFMDAESRALSAAALERRRMGMAERYDFKLRHKDGSDRWVIVAAAPLTVSGGAFTGVLALISDVTERRAAEDSQRQSQALFHSAFAYAAIGMSVVDMAGRFIQVNEALCSLVGYSEAELLATTYQSITHPEDQEIEGDSAAKLLAGEIPTFQIEKRYRHKQGHTIWVLVSVSLVRDAAGVAVYNVAQVQDVTVRKRAIAALQESNERNSQMLAEAQSLRQFNESIAEVMAEGLLLEDEAGSITLVNPKLQAMLGYSSDELVGKNAAALVAARDRDLVSRHTAQRPAGITSSYEAALLTKDGRELPVLISATPLTKDGRFAGTLATLTDISSRIQAEAALKDANAQLTAWLADSTLRTREVGLLNDLGDLLHTSLAPEEAYGVVAEKMPALFPGSAGRIYIFKESRNLVEAVSQWGPVAGEALPFIPSECWGLRRGRLYSAEHLDDHSASVVCQHLAHPWPPGYLCVPMVAQSETLGVLHLQQQTAGADSELDGDIHWTSDRQQLARTVAESLGQALANLRLRESLRQQSIRDPLTGLFNRRYLEETLQRELSRAAREKKPVGVLMLDLDHFKLFNDAWGHAAGDRLLREFGSVLQGHARGADIACRYGGEEFTLILPGASAAVTYERAERLTAAMAELRPDPAVPAGHGVTVSIGIAIFPADGAGEAELLRAADTALYRAKHAGRNRIATAA